MTPEEYAAGCARIAELQAELAAKAQALKEECGDERGDIGGNDILTEMERTGGGFVKALAAAAYKADPENYRRLKVAFPEYWRTYEQRARMRAANDAGAHTVQPCSICRRDHGPEIRHARE